MLLRPACTKSARQRRGTSRGIDDQRRSDSIIPAFVLDGHEETVGRLSNRHNPTLQDLCARALGSQSQSGIEACAIYNKALSARVT